MKASYFFTVLLLTAFVQVAVPWWWTLVLVPALAALGNKYSARRLVTQAAAAVALVWLGYALLLYSTSDGLLTKRLTESFNLPHPILLFVLLVVVAGLLGGLGALCGYRLRRHVVPTKSVNKNELATISQDYL